MNRVIWKRMFENELLKNNKRLDKRLECEVKN